MIKESTFMLIWLKGGLAYKCIINLQNSASSRSFLKGRKRGGQWLSCAQCIQKDYKLNALDGGV